MEILFPGFQVVSILLKLYSVDLFSIENFEKLHVLSKHLRVFRGAQNNIKRTDVSVKINRKESRERQQNTESGGQCRRVQGFYVPKGELLRQRPDGTFLGLLEAGAHLSPSFCHLCGGDGGEPVPGKNAFYVDDDICSIRYNDLLKAFWCSSHILVEYHVAFCIHDVNIHRPCVQVDSDIKLMMFFVESHKGPPY